MIAVQDGDEIAGSYAYEETEPDLRVQMDDRTSRVAAGTVRQSASIANLLDVMYARPYGSVLDTVRFDEATQTFVLSSDFGLSPPDAVRINSLTRRKLLDVDAGTVEARINFDRPSNVMFLPAEYATVNCEMVWCDLSGIVLTGNGSTVSISVPVGTSVSLIPSKKQPGSTCQKLFYRWTKGGVYMPWNPQGAQSYVFGTAGSYRIGAEGECVGCDVIRVGYLTVNATGSCSPGKAYEFHRNNFTHRPDFIISRYNFSVSAKTFRFGFNWFSAASSPHRSVFEDGAKAWNGTRSACGSYTVVPTVVFGTEITSQVTHISRPAPFTASSGAEACGRFTPTSSTGQRDVIEIVHHSDCPRPAETATHEVGHLLGFRDAGGASGSGDAGDVMGNRGSTSRTVKGYHARVLVEKYASP